MTIGVSESLSCWFPASVTSIALAGIVLHETFFVTCKKYASEQKAREAFETGQF